jgi:hypothetical protein
MDRFRLNQEVCDAHWLADTVTVIRRRIGTDLVRPNETAWSALLRPTEDQDAWVQRISEKQARDLTGSSRD